MVKLEKIDESELVLMVLKCGTVPLARRRGVGGLWEAIPMLRHAFDRFRRKQVFSHKTKGSFTGGVWFLHPHWDWRRRLWDVHLHLVLHAPSVIKEEDLKQAWVKCGGRGDSDGFSIEGVRKGGLLQYVDYICAGLPRAFVGSQDKKNAERRRKTWDQIAYEIAVAPRNEMALIEYLSSMKGRREYGTFGS